jgi:hypothetical protein
MKRLFYKSVNRIALWMGMDRLANWSYLKWFNLYMTSGDPMDYFRFFDDYLDTDIAEKEKK